MNPTDYKIRKVEVLRTRYLDAESPAYDVTRLVVEFNFFESIYTPYITGSLVIADAAAISSMINFQGQEELVIEFEVGERIIRKEFIIYSIPSTIKSLSDATSTYVLDFIEKRGYIGAFRRLRGSYSGKIESILSTVFDEPIDVLENSDQNIKVLGVNRTPIEMSYWLIDRATSDIGEPMFFYSSLNNGLKFTSLGEMLNRQPLHDIVFRYSQLPYSGVKNRFLYEATIIQTMSIGEQDNMLIAAESGAVKSRMFSIDTLTKTVDHIDFSAAAHFELKKENSKTLYDQTLFDKNFAVDGQVISNAESNYLAQVNTTSLYKDIKSYDEDDLFAQRNKMSRKSDLVLLNRERFEIVIPGFYGLSSGADTTIGTVINISVPKDQPSFSESDIDRIEDKKRSGKFLVTNARHIFDIDGNYRISLSVARIETPDNINDEGREENEKRPR